MEAYVNVILFHFIFRRRKASLYGVMSVGLSVGRSVGLQKILKNNKMRFRDYIDVDYGLNRPKPVFRRKRCLNNWLCQLVCLK